MNSEAILSLCSALEELGIQSERARAELVNYSTRIQEHKDEVFEKYMRRGGFAT